MSEAAQGPNTGRSIMAVAAGFFLVFVLSLGTDQILHMVGFYPPWGEPFRRAMEPGAALGYRIVYAVIGARITARLAPWKPMKHVWIQAGIGQILALGGLVPPITDPAKFGPLWYPAVLALTVIPTAWIGGQLYLRGRASA